MQCESEFLSFLSWNGNSAVSMDRKGGLAHRADMWCELRSDAVPMGVAELLSGMAYALRGVYNEQYPHARESGGFPRGTESIQMN